MSRLPLGLDSAENPADDMRQQQVMTHQHDDRLLYDKLCPLMVKIYAFSRVGEPAGEFSGFLYSSSSTIIVSAAGRMIGRCGGSPPGSAPPAEVFTVRYSDGFEEDVEVVEAARNCVPDLAILRGSRAAPGRSLCGMPCSAGDVVYALGYSQSSTNPSFGRVAVSSAKVGHVAITAHADRGHSGGPVVNRQGQLVGVITSPLLGPSMNTQVAITPAADVHTFLLQCGQSGLA